MSQTATSTEIPYVGDELELFAQAQNWKSYLRQQISPYLGRRVLEVGAGIGATTRMLCDGSQELWRCLEPDKPMAELLSAQVANGELPACCQAQAGTVADVHEEFDSIIYIDVLEHIPEDRAQLQLAAERVRPGGYIVVLSPAHQHLYTAFDRRIGHCRRYSKRMLRDLTPSALKIETLRYLDCVGYFASLANRLLLRQSMPTLNQIRVWDGLMVPVSRLTDRFLGYEAGKSVLCVWQKGQPGESSSRGGEWKQLLLLIFLVTSFAIAGFMIVPPRSLEGRFNRGNRGIRLTHPMGIVVGGLVGTVVYSLIVRRRNRKR